MKYLLALMILIMGLTVACGPAHAWIGMNSSKLSSWFPYQGGNAPGVISYVVEAFTDRYSAEDGTSLYIPES